MDAGDGAAVVVVVVEVVVVAASIENNLMKEKIFEATWGTNMSLPHCNINVCYFIVCVWVRNAAFILHKVIFPLDMRFLLE